MKSSADIRVADSINDRNKSYNTQLLSAPDDDDVTHIRQDQDSSEDSNALKDMHLHDTDGNERGNYDLYEREFSYESDEAVGKQYERKRMGILTVSEVAELYGKRYAAEMQRRGIKTIDRDVFAEAYESDRMLRMAEHIYKLSDEYTKSKDGEKIINYYDNWDVEWALFSAKDYVEKGKRLGEYKSANAARQAAHEKGDGNYVIEGTALLDGSYWGYYVVSIKNGKTTRYAKKPIIVHETHEKREAANKNKLIEIKEMEFMAETVTAGRYVRARMSKRNAHVMKQFAKAAGNFVDSIDVGSRTFPEKADRKMMLKLMDSIVDSIDQLRGLAETLGPEDQEALSEVVTELQEMTGMGDTDDETMMGGGNDGGPNSAPHQSSEFAPAPKVM